MRCSLLALSSYLDTELDLEPTGELEAHLVACERCRTAIGHLREESARIGGLARVHVPDDAVHDLFSQIGLIAEEDDLPEGPVHHDRPAPVEAPPWFGAERGAALPWAPRPTGQDHAQPRELIGERSPTTAVAEPPELLLWDETIDQIATATPAPAPPPLLVVPAPDPVMAPEIAAEPYPIAHVDADPGLHEPQPPQLVSEPQPPDLSTSAPMYAAPRLAAGPSAFQRFRDAIAVRFALRRGGNDALDSGVEIVSGAGAPKWNQRTHTRHWSDSPPVIAAVPPVVVAPDAVAPDAVASPEAGPSSSPVAKQRHLSRFLAGLDARKVAVEAEPASATEAMDDDPGDSYAPAAHDSRRSIEATATPELADVLSEVASLAAPLDRSAVPPAEPEVAPDHVEPADDYVSPALATPTGATAASRDIEYLGVATAAAFTPEIPTSAPASMDTPYEYDERVQEPPAPGRHVRRLQSQKPDRREWNPTHPVTGRHVLPLGGPAVGAADRDRRLWLFGAVTVGLMLLGLLVGRQVTQTAPLAATLPPSSTTHHATTPATAAPLPVATPAPAVLPLPTAVIPVSPTPQQLTGAKTIGSGSSGFSVADVRYGEHPNDFRLVFDMAFPDSVSGSPTTVIGYDGPTTLYVEFTGVNGASDVATMPAHQIVMSAVALPQARDTGRLIFKITLSKNAPFDAYYLSGARLVIDIT